MVAPTIERDVSAIVNEAIKKHGAKKDALIPILSEINHTLGYIPAEAFEDGGVPPHLSCLSGHDLRQARR